MAAPTRTATLRLGCTPDEVVALETLSSLTRGNGKTALRPQADATELRLRSVRELDGFFTPSP